MKNFYSKLTLIIFICLAFFTNADALADSVENALLRDCNQETYANKENAPITDELLNPELYGDAPFRMSVYTNNYANQAIEDELLEESDFVENANNYVLTDKVIPDEYFIEKNIDLTKVRKIKSKNKYDFTKKLIPIKIKIAEQLKSTRELLEGSTIPFIAQHDFEINGKKFNKGTKILGRVETISESDKMGTPESIKISNFYIPDEKEIDLSGSVSKTGANRSIWVYPLYQAGNVCLYVAGFVFVPIHGGRAKLLTSESFTLFYETQ
jgi:hypothetical protein